ncbi:hypothetical protein BDV10DRAFT_186233 [Aspergillus recurvatus]
MPRGRRPSPNKPIIDGIWQGRLPAHVPDPARGHPPDLTHLGQYMFHQLVNYMADFPNLAVQIFDWGCRQANRWPSHRQFADETEVAQWHNIHFPGTAIPTTQAGRQAITANARSRGQWPLDELVKKDAVHALQELHNASHWNPLGFRASGCSFLNTAAQSESWLVYNYILYEARENRAYARARPAAQALSLTPITRNHLDLAIQVGPYDAFVRWWKILDKVHLRLPPRINRIDLSGPPPVLQPASLEALCRKIPNGMAESLLTNNRLDLTTTPGAWHLAVENGFTSFMDFLFTRGAATRINGTVGANGSPLEYARTNSRLNTRARLRAFRKLVQRGANVGNYIQSELINNWPTVKDRFFTSALVECRNINPASGSPNANGGTLIHRVVNRLSDQLTATAFTNLNNQQQRKLRKKLTDEAKALIHHIRRGNRHGQPNLGTVDAAGSTAIQLAQQKGLTELYSSLLAAEFPGQTPNDVPGHQYPVRRTRRRST